MLAFQFDVADLRTLRHLVRMQRRLPLFKQERPEFVLIVENVNQSTVGGRRWQEFLGAFSSRYENDEESQKNNSLNVSHILVHAVCSL